MSFHGVLLLVDFIVYAFFAFYLFDCTSHLLRAALNKQIRFTKATSTRMQMFMKRRIFLHESAFRQHEASESAHGNRIFLVTVLLSGVRPAATRTRVK